MSYWDSVPVGTWTVVDTEDCLSAVNDKESRCHIDYHNKRINIYGPIKKSLIVDLATIKKLMGSGHFLEFLAKIENIIYGSI